MFVMQCSEATCCSFELRREGDGGSHFILVNNKNSAGAGTVYWPEVHT